MFFLCAEKQTFDLAFLTPGKFACHSYILKNGCYLSEEIKFIGPTRHQIYPQQKTNRVFTL